MSPLQKASLEMKAERSSGHGMDLTVGKNGVPVLSAGVRIRRGSFKTELCQSFPFVRQAWTGFRHRGNAGGRKCPKSRHDYFFDWDYDGCSDHVGIVESCDGTTVHTIEGNSGDAVRQNSYTVNSQSILGYGLVAY